MSLQDFYFITMFFAAVISLIGALIFYNAYVRENALQAPWRAIGFGSLSLAFLLAIIQIKWSFLYEVSLFFEAFGFLGIYRGMTIDPYVSYLQNASSAEFDKNVDAGISRNKREGWVRRGLTQFAQTEDPDSNTFTVLTLTSLLGILFTILHFDVGMPYISLVFLSISLLYIFRTITLQIYRLITEKSGKKVGIYNIFALTAYVFFTIRFFILALLLIPSAQRLEVLPIDDSTLLGISIFATFGGLLCVALWLWPFIRSRMSIRRTKNHLE